MGAAGFHGRVRNGVGWDTRAIGHQVDEPPHSARGGVGAPAAAARPRRDQGHPCGGRRRVIGKFRHGLGLRLSLLGIEVVRAIRTGQLHASPRVHTRPIDVVVYHGSDGETWFCGRFPA